MQATKAVGRPCVYVWACQHNWVLRTRDSNKRLRQVVAQPQKPTTTHRLTETFIFEKRKRKKQKPVAIHSFVRRAVVCLAYGLETFKLGVCFFFYFLASHNIAKLDVVCVLYSSCTFRKLPIGIDHRTSTVQSAHELKTNDTNQLLLCYTKS